MRTAEPISSSVRGMRGPRFPPGREGLVLGGAAGVLEDDDLIIFMDLS